MTLDKTYRSTCLGQGKRTSSADPFIKKKEVVNGICARDKDGTCIESKVDNGARRPQYTKADKKIRGIPLVAPVISAF
jgi:hypothetical protein